MLKIIGALKKPLLLQQLTEENVFEYFSTQYLTHNVTNDELNEFYTDLLFTESRTPKGLVQKFEQIIESNTSLKLKKQIFVDNLPRRVS